jgi:hypothetical protein
MRNDSEVIAVDDQLTHGKGVIKMNFNNATIIQGVQLLSVLLLSACGTDIGVVAPTTLAPTEKVATEKIATSVVTPTTEPSNKEPEIEYGPE